MLPFVILVFRVAIHRCSEGTKDLASTPSHNPLPAQQKKINNKTNEGKRYRLLERTQNVKSITI